MNEIVIRKSVLRGDIALPPSKSMSHRAIFCASLAENQTSTIKNISLSEDIKATIDCCRNLGANITYDKNSRELLIESRIFDESDIYRQFYCSESGTTLRFIIPIAMSLFKKTIFSGDESLMKRPLDTYFRLFDNLGIDYHLDDELFSLVIDSKFISAQFEIDGKTSSQFISGLLLAAPLLNKDVTISLTTELESKNYVDLTVDVMKNFGINVNKNIADNKLVFTIASGQKYESCNYIVESDCSQAAFWGVSNYIGNHVEFVDITDTEQGDVEIFEHLRKLSELSKIYKENKMISEYIIDAKNIPDIIPILAGAAALSKGVNTKIINAERLRIKETDRFKVTVEVISKLGGIISEEKNILKITGAEKFYGDVELYSYNDHRIAMMIGILATVCENEVVLSDYMAVKKSYPDFWDVYEKLGGNIRKL